MMITAKFEKTARLLAVASFASAGPRSASERVDQIFSKTRQGSGGREIKTWDGVGLTGDWEAKPISLYGRNSASGTHEFFREMVLYNGEYKDDVKEQSDSATVVQMIANDKFAIGYSGIGYKTTGVRAVPLAISAGRKCYNTSSESAFSGDCPIARYLYIYLNKNPNQPLDPLLTEFAKYVLSNDGQTLTLKGGFYPLCDCRISGHLEYRPRIERSLSNVNS
jgi:phosphate transport system substrate-binding protein